MISFIIIVQIHFSWIAATHTYVIRIYSFRWKKWWHNIYSKFNNFFLLCYGQKNPYLCLPWSLLFLLVVRGSSRNSNFSWGIWGITFAIPRGMRKMRNQIFHSPGNEETELAKIFGDGDPPPPHWDIYLLHFWVMVLQLSWYVSNTQS